MRTYSFDNTIMLVNGVEITGWTEGDDVIDISRNVDSATHKIGNGGQMAVAYSTDKSGTLKFKLMQTSSSNRYLNTLLNLQESGAQNSTGIAVKFQDTFRQDMASGSAGYIKKQADLKRGRNIADQEWEIVVESLRMVFGDTGNQSVLGQGVANL